MILSAVVANLHPNLQAHLLVPIAFFPVKLGNYWRKSRCTCVLIGKKIDYIIHCTSFSIFCKEIMNQHQVITTEFQSWVFFYIGVFSFPSFLVSPVWFFPSSLQAELWVKLFIMLGMSFLLSVPRSLGWDSFILTFAHKNEMSAC